ncbi:MAG TPA: hypothetical protein VFC43_06575 [Methanoregula sp.]|nr:hypothetical protein [Methanoregula sp.]
MDDNPHPGADVHIHQRPCLAKEDPDNNASICTLTGQWNGLVCSTSTHAK